MRRYSGRSSGKFSFKKPIVFVAMAWRNFLSTLVSLQVDDGRKDRGNDGEQQQETEKYQVERIATVLAVSCMFLSALYTIFAVLLFLCYASDDALSNDNETDVANSHAKTPLVSVTGAVSTDQRQLDSPGFITMENSSQGTSDA